MNLKNAAHSKVQYAVRRGWLVRPPQCEECSGPGPIEGHHADYTRPLDVRWLCRKCHGAQHHAEPLVDSVTLTWRMDADQIAALDLIAEQRKVTRSALVREALREMLKDAA